MVADVKITDTRYLTADIHVRTLTIRHPGVLYPNGHRIFVDHLLEADVLGQIGDGPVPADASPL